MSDSVLGPPRPPPAVKRCAPEPKQKETGAQAQTQPAKCKPAKQPVAKVEPGNWLPLPKPALKREVEPADELRLGPLGISAERIEHDAQNALRPGDPTMTITGTVGQGRVAGYVQGQFSSFQGLPGSSLQPLWDMSAWEVGVKTDLGTVAGKKLSLSTGYNHAPGPKHAAAAELDLGDNLSIQVQETVSPRREMNVFLRWKVTDDPFGWLVGRGR